MPSVGTKTLLYDILKVQNRSKIAKQSDVFSDCQAQTHRSQVL